MSNVPVKPVIAFNGVRNFMRHAGQKIIFGYQGSSQLKIFLLQFDIFLFQGLLKFFSLTAEPAYNKRAQRKRDEIRHLVSIDSERMDWRYEEVGGRRH